MSAQKKFANRKLSNHDGQTPQEQGVVVMGRLPASADDIPATPPAGFVWMQGGSWWGEWEGFGLADIRISVAGQNLDFVITLDDAISVRALLDRTIEDMQRCMSHEPD